jgi:calcium/calmodulin-dependent protein kinase (CaM kinase) II
MTDELLTLTQALLNSIAAGDWETYQRLCAPDLTAIEPEAPGQLVEGLAFHRYYFDLGGVKGPHQTTMCQPRVKLLGAEVAIVTYARVIQKLGLDGHATSTTSMETRIWQRIEGQWRHVHFHRSTY